MWSNVSSTSGANSKPRPLLRMCAAHIWSLFNKTTQCWELWVTTVTLTQLQLSDIDGTLCLQSSWDDGRPAGPVTTFVKEVRGFDQKQTSNMSSSAKNNDLFIQDDLLDSLSCHYCSFVERSASFILDSLLESSQSQLILNFFTLWTKETFLREPKSPHFSPTYT